MRTLGYFFLSLRPKQWAGKNSFIFAPAVFALHLFQPVYLLNSLKAFLLFSLVTGAIYVFNDIADRESDRHHPQKQKRPIAAGKLAPLTAGILALVLLAVVLYLIFVFQRSFFIITLAYILMNFLYSVFLKSLIIIDIMMIALGFVLRLLVGSAVNAIELSPWILICTFLLAIFLALVKRRQELVQIASISGNATRKTLQSYNVGLVDQMISICTATTLISYIMYVTSPDVQQKFHTNRLFYTIPFVIFAIFRYLYLSYARGKGENPTEIVYGDLAFALNLVLWLGVFIYLVMQ